MKPENVMIDNPYSLDFRSVEDMFSALRNPWTVQKTQRPDGKVVTTRTPALVLNLKAINLFLEFVWD